MGFEPMVRVLQVVANPALTLSRTSAVFDEVPSAIQLLRSRKTLGRPSRYYPESGNGPKRLPQC